MARDHRLIRQGFLLFLLFLLALLGGLFAYVGPRATVVAFWAALVGAYANWLVPLFSAVVGGSQPRLAGAGFEAAPWQEALLSASPVAGVLAPIVCRSLLVWGLRAKAAA
jgi:hypothetical protein